jgi:hypothetical protein
LGAIHKKPTTNQVRLEKRKNTWLGVFGVWSWELRERERERGAMHALRTLFISCVRKVGKYNKEFFIFKKICHL